MSRASTRNKTVFKRISDVRIDSWEGCNRITDKRIQIDTWRWGQNICGRLVNINYWENQYMLRKLAILISWTKTERIFWLLFVIGWGKNTQKAIADLKFVIVVITGSIRKRNGVLKLWIWVACRDKWDNSSILYIFRNWTKGWLNDRRLLQVINWESNHLLVY